MGDLLTLAELENKTLKEIYGFAKAFKIPYYSQMNKKELSLAVLRMQEEKQGFFIAEGVLDIVSQEGFGFYAQSITHQAKKIFIFQCHKSDVLDCEMEIRLQEKRDHLNRQNVTTV